MTDDKIDILNLYIEEIEKILYDMNQEKYRAKQIFQWLHKGVKDFGGMTNLSAELRNRLAQTCRIGKLDIKSKLVSKIDGTAKYLLELEDGNAIESVLMSYKHGLSICISSQVGCKMGCRFCASSKLGFSRDLTPGEMIDQLITVMNDTGKRISNIVIMGIGEPLDNYDNVVKFLRLVNDPSGLNIGFRHISVSTSGLVPKIRMLAEEKIPVTLSISLHAPNDDIRNTIMPVAKKYGMDEIIAVCREYVSMTGRRITFEYAMISGINDSRDNALELASRLKGLICHVNLIPVNEIAEENFRRSSKEAIERFKSVLESRGIETTVRRELGSDINASCGQLRRRMMQN